MNNIDQLVETLRSVDEIVAVVAIVATFFTLAAILWSWRKITLQEDEAL